MNVKYQTEVANINAKTIMVATFVSAMKAFHWVIMERTVSVSWLNTELTIQFNLTALFLLVSC